MKDNVHSARRKATEPTSPRRSHWESVYNETRRRILTLELPPGSPLSEIALARDFGISATPARDALGRLRQEGLVVAGAGRRYSVAGLSISDVSELAEHRFVLETGIVQSAIQRRASPSLTEARKAARQLERQNLNPSELIDYNEHFHLAVAELTGNGRLVEALRHVLNDSRRVFHLGIAALPIDEMVKAHHRLLDAIEARDLPSAVAVCEEEAFGTSERVVSQLVRGSAAGARHISVLPLAPESVENLRDGKEPTI